MGFSLHCKNKFWLENIVDLFCSYQVIPKLDTSLEIQCNTLTRLFILIFVFLLIFGDFKSSLTFLILSLLFIIILYYIQRKSMNNQKENFENVIMDSNYTKHANNIPNNKNMNFGNYTATDKDLNNHSHIYQNYIASNNLENAIPAVNIPFGIHQEVKTPSMKDLTRNYIQSNRANKNCYTERPLEEFYSNNHKLVGHAHPKTLINPVLAPRAFDLDHWRANNLVNHSGTNNENMFDEYRFGYKSVYDTPEKTVNFEFPYEKENDCDSMGMFNPKIPSVLKACGDSSYCGVIDYKNHSENKNRDKIYSEEFGICNYEEPSVSDIYDPRFTGYGTGYRSYIDPVAGQPRFYYDDINSVKMPDISRSNIDFAKNANPLATAMYANTNMRELAEKSFVQHQLDNRTSLSESLMRKKNIEALERRNYPMRRF